MDDLDMPADRANMLPSRYGSQHSVAVKELNLRI